MKNQKRCEVYPFKFRAAFRWQCHLTTPMLPFTDKSEATGSSSSRGKKSICFIFYQTVQSCYFCFCFFKEKKAKANQATAFFPSSLHHANSDSASVMFLLVLLVLGALRYVSSGVGLHGQVSPPEWSRNGTCISHDVESNICPCPAGKRGFRLVIFFFCFFVFFPPSSFFGKDASGGTKRRKTRTGVKNMNCESISCQDVPACCRSEQTQLEKKKDVNELLSHEDPLAFEAPVRILSTYSLCLQCRGCDVVHHCGEMLTARGLGG